MNCHITIHNGDSRISIRGKWKALKKFLPIRNFEAEPGYLCLRDENRRIEVVNTPETPEDAKIGIDLTKQYLKAIKDKSGETVLLEREELSKIIRQLELSERSI